MFKPWTDPLSSVTSFILTAQVAPVQMSLPAVNPSVSNDEHWLWFVCRHPPSPTPTIGVVALDPEREFIRHFPQAGFSGVAPLVAPEGDAVFFCADASVYRISVRGHVSEVIRLPDSFLAGRHLWRLATHLTRSSDGRYLLLDGVLGNESFIAIGDLASGQVEIVKEFQAHHGCAQFSPINAEELLIAQLPHTDPVTGRRLHEDLRPHVMDIHGHNYHCIAPHVPCGDSTGIAFEWFLSDGHIAYVDFESGVWLTDGHMQRHEHVWNAPLCHADADHSMRWWCGDNNPAHWDDQPCAVLVYDRQRDRSFAIDAGMPAPIYPRHRVKVAPFPRFSPQGTWVVYTTTRRGGVDVALCPIDEFDQPASGLASLEAEPERETEESSASASGGFNPPL